MVSMPNRGRTPQRNCQFALRLKKVATPWNKTFFSKSVAVDLHVVNRADQLFIIGRFKKTILATEEMVGLWNSPAMEQTGMVFDQEKNNGLSAQESQWCPVAPPKSPQNILQVLVQRFTICRKKSDRVVSP